MYKVLLVDDERIILDGITAIVDWTSAETVLAGTARNGLEAYEFIAQHPPDIVISDIKMPGMDGLQLAAKVSQEYPGIRFIMLSGFGEFEYAQSAMRYGVKHYLVKPCNENKIASALREVVAELKADETKAQFVRSMKEGLVKVLPHVKEQFLKEFVTNKTYGGGDWEYYRKLFELDLGERKVRLALFQLEGAFEFEHLFAVKNIAGDILSNIVLSSTVGDHVLLVAEDANETDMHEKMELIRQTFLKYYKIDLTIALSEAGDITQARSLYKQTLECLNHRFYLGEGGLITKRDLAGTGERERKEFVFDEEKLLLEIKAGRWDGAKAGIEQYFGQIGEQRFDIHTAKSYVIQLFMAIIRLGDEEQMNAHMQKLVSLMELNTLQALQAYLQETASDICQKRYRETVGRHSAIVQKVIDSIEEQLGNPELSLGWVAHELLYMNADYLGKLFKKETGEKFSNYVMKARITKATELIERSPDVKIFELAEQLGFGDNPQYFSQVFKKYVGCTPSEYMKA
ncbi:response regulator [Paenibacillus hamazuiensis]|uniref:response regulator n=1 Tax=Paenibacillus hamazuiensis TaxID=2936508 RepID=UPI00200EAACB|nr:response regulator [Paenibacillus hamazuiensis]